MGRNSRYNLRWHSLPAASNPCTTECIKLPPEIEHALSLGWPIAIDIENVHCHPHEVCSFSATTNRSSIVDLYARYSHSILRWMVPTGTSLRRGRNEAEIIVIKIEIKGNKQLLWSLHNSSQVWQRTLRLRTAMNIFFFFREPKNRLLFSQINESIDVYRGRYVLIPPTVVNGEQLKYHDATAVPLELPNLKPLFSASSLHKVP